MDKMRKKYGNTNRALSNEERLLADLRTAALNNKIEDFSSFLSEARSVTNALAAQDDNGDTLLMIAVKEEHEETVEFILGELAKLPPSERHRILCIADNNGHTVFNISTTENITELLAPVRSEHDEVKAMDLDEELPSPRKWQKKVLSSPKDSPKSL